jgi:hypothetical protein
MLKLLFFESDDSALQQNDISQVFAVLYQVELCDERLSVKEVQISRYIVVGELENV